MALIKCFLKKTKDEEENIKMQQMAPKNLEQNATNPIGLLFCNLKKGDQVSLFGTLLYSAEYLCPNGED